MKMPRLLFPLLFFSFPLIAQVAVAPPIVFCSPDHRFGDLIVENKTTVPQEVSVEFAFGYPVSDSLGAMGMQYGDTVTEKRCSLKPHVKVFPKKFVLQPGDKQIVRVASSVPVSLADGFYWTRIITTSAAQQAAIDTLRKDITTKINYVFKQVTTAAYEKGMMKNSLSIAGKGICKTADKTSILWHAELSGNAPYFGTAKTKVYDAGGALVDETEETLALYVSMMKRSTLNKKLPAGTYTVEVSMTPRRTDIPSEMIDYGSSSDQRFTIVLP